MQIPFFARLAQARSVLLLDLGVGGGAGLAAVPLLAWLRAQGKVVTVGVVTNACRADVEEQGEVRIEPVGPTGWRCPLCTEPVDRYYESGLAWWLPDDVELLAFERGGVLPFAESLRAAAARRGADAVVVVDRGTDALCKGDEADIGDSWADVAAVAAADLLDLPTKLMACIGFGLDVAGGSCPRSFLENVSEAIRAGGHLGCVSVTRESPEGQALLSAAERVAAEGGGLDGASASIAGAVEGAFAEEERTALSDGGDPFTNPLMATYWTFDLPVVAAMMGAREALSGTRTGAEVRAALASHRERVMTREWLALPY